MPQAVDLADPRASSHGTEAAPALDTWCEPQHAAPMGSQGAHTAMLHLRFGNALVHAALASPSEGALGSFVAGQVLLDAADVGNVGTLSSNVAMQTVLAGLTTAGGVALPERTKTRMEWAFDHDFSDVRIHTDALAAAAVKALDAHAAALGAHIFMGAGQWAPGTRRGDRLLAHELTHVVQHHEGRLPHGTGPLDVSHPSDPSEREAYANEHAMAGRLAAIDRAMQVGDTAGAALGIPSLALLGVLEQGLGERLSPALAEQLLGRLGDMSATDGPAALADAVGSELSASLTALSEGLMSAGVEQAPVMAPSVARLAGPARQSELPDVLGEIGTTIEGMSEDAALGGALDALSTGALFAVGQALTSGSTADPMQGEMPGDMMGPAALQIAQTGTARSLPHKAEMESRFGVDLSQVQAYTGAPARQACEVISARAFAVKNVVVFASEDPSADVVAHEITHVIQQGGHLHGGQLAGVPARLPLSKPGDAAEQQADRAGAQNAGGDGLEAGTFPASAARLVDVSGTQNPVLASVVKGAIPAGYSSNIETFNAVGDGIQGSIDSVSGVINSATAFPISDVESLFSGDAFSFIDPEGWATSLQPSGDSLVEDVVLVVLAVCDIALAVLDGLLGTINQILEVVNAFVELLSKAASTLDMIAKVLFAIAAALAATMFGAAAAAVLTNIANTCQNIASTIKNIADMVSGFIEPLNQVVEQINKIKGYIEQVREICQIIQLCCDVFNFLTADTAEERASAAQDILGNLDAIGGFLGDFEGGAYSGFAGAFWTEAKPAITGALQGQAGAAGGEAAGGGEGGGEMTAGAPSGEGAGAAAPAQPEGGAFAAQLEAVQAVSQDQATRPQEAVQVYEQIAREEHVKDTSESHEMTASDPGRQVDGPGMVRRSLAGQDNGAAGQAPTQGSEAPASAPAGEGGGVTPGPGESTWLPQALSTATQPGQTATTLSAVPQAAFQAAAKMAEQAGYPVGVQEVFDYVNDVIAKQENAGVLQEESRQRQAEAQDLQTNAEQTIQAMEATKATVAEQDTAAKEDQAANEEGMSFMDYLTDLSAQLQAKLEEKIDEMMGAGSDTDAAGGMGMDSESGAGGGADGGMTEGGSAMGIIKKVSTAVLKMVLGKILEQFNVGEILKSLIPGDMADMLELVFNFVEIATGTGDKAKEKDAEAMGAQASLGASVGVDLTSQDTAAANTAQADAIIAEAQATIASAQGAEQQAIADEQAAVEFDGSLKTEQSTVESSVETRVSEAGPLRPRTPVDQVTPPADFDLPPGPVSAEDVGPMVETGLPVPVSADQGVPDAVAGPSAQPPQQSGTTADQAPGAQSGAGEAGAEAGEQGGEAGETGASPQAGAEQGASEPGAGEQGTAEQGASGGGEGAGGEQTTGQAASTAAGAEQGAEGGGMGSGAGAWEEALMTIRDLEPDRQDATTGVQARSEDPQPPPPLPEHRAEIADPVAASVQDQGTVRAEQVQQAVASVPETQTLYDSLDPLPTPAPPDPAVTEVVPLDGSGMGYGEDQVLIDADVGSVNGWSTNLPDSITLLQPGEGGGAEIAPLPAPVVTPVTPTTAASLPATPSVDVAASIVPAIPVSEVARDNPALTESAQDVMRFDVVQEEHAKALEAAARIAGEHESQEATILQTAQSEAVSVQEVQASMSAQALAERDTGIAEARTAWSDEQAQVVSDLEQQAEDRQTSGMDQAETSLSDGRTSADGTLREGEAQAEGVQEQASAGATDIKGQAAEKAQSLWGWLSDQISTFCGNIASMLGGLWAKANQAISAVLEGAASMAMGLLDQARSFATDALNALGIDLQALYGEVAGRLAQLGERMTAWIGDTMDAALQMLADAAQMAMDAVGAVLAQAEAAVRALADATLGLLGEAWGAFEELAQEIREAVQVFDTGVTGEQAASEVEGGEATSAEAQAVQGEAQAGGSDGAQTDSPEQSGEPGQGEGAAVSQAGSDSATAQCVSDFVGQTPTEQAASYPNLGTEMNTAAQGEEQTFQDGVQPLPATMQGEVDFQPEPATVAAPTPVELSGPAGGDMPQAEVAETAQAPTGDVANANAPSYGEGADYRDRARDTAGSINEVATTDADLETDPGPAPQVPLQGAADPQQLDDQAAEASAGAERAVAEAQQAVADSPGPEQVQPIAVDETYAVEGLEQAAVESTEAVAEMEQYLAFGLSGDVSGQFDLMQGPTMQANLAEVQQEVDGATATRDADRDTAMADAAAEVERLSSDAQTEQEAAVTEQRDRITAERQRTMDEQARAMQDMRGQAETERAKTMSQVDTRVSADQARVNDAFTKAKRDADSEVTQGEQKAEAEKRKAESEADDRSWWEKAVDFVADCLSALADAINSIFDAVRQAVTAIIDAVKDLACAIVDAACAFVCSVIEAYGELLKGLIQGLLGDIFPGLADALCSFVDSAVEVAQNAVRAAADGLKQGIAALAETLKAGLNALLAAWQAAINGALAIAQAIISGDWAELLKKIIEAALTLAGIDPAEFYAMVGTAEETLTTIIDDPGAFVSHCIDAAAQGFSQFGDNFLTHLQNGFIEWMTGQMGEAGIQLPDTWDAAGIFSVVLQVMGITYDNMRQKAVDRIGEENVARLEFVWGFISAAIEGGLEGLWQHVQDQLAGLYDQVIDAIQSFLMQKVVIAAVTKIASMFNPVGAIVQALITAWNVYQFLRDQIQRIYGVVQSFIEGLAAIAAGNIGPAANRVEQALADLVPIAIDLLARLLGLGGLSAKIREVIESVQQWVSDAIDKLLDKVIGMFKGGEEDGDKKFDGTVGEEVQFSAGDEGHREWVEASGGSVKVMVASTPMPVPDRLSDWDRRMKDTPNAQHGVGGVPEDKWGEATSLIGAARSQNGVVEAAAQAVVNTTDDDAKAAADDKLEAEQRTLGGKLKPLFDLYNDAYPDADKLPGRLKGMSEAELRRHGEAIDHAHQPMDAATVAALEQVAEKAKAAASANGEVDTSFIGDMAGILRAYDGQRFSSNPILGEAWDRGVASFIDNRRGDVRAKASSFVDFSSNVAEFRRRLKALGPNPDSDFIQKMMDDYYKEAAGHGVWFYESVRKKMDQNLAAISTEVKAVYPNLSLPTNIKGLEVHHLLYKAKVPSSAITKENLLLAGRGTKALPALHDMLHLVTAAGDADRYNVLAAVVRATIEDLTGADTADPV